jgi:hypothetical protein
MTKWMMMLALLLASGPITSCKKNFASPLASGPTTAEAVVIRSASVDVAQKELNLVSYKSGEDHNTDMTQRSF